MKLTTLSLVATLMLLQGCSSSDDTVTDSERPAASRPASSTQVDVFAGFIAEARSTPDSITDSVNLFSNSGFEDGLTGWSDCQPNASSVSNDAYEGNAALQLASDHCFYRSVQVTPGESYALDCFVRLDVERAWTGMGLSFADDAYNLLAQAPVAVATSGEYTRLSTVATAPAGSAFVSMWIHSDHGASVDNCSLTLELNQAPGSIGNIENLLVNGDFALIDDQSGAADWATGCGGSSIADSSGLFLTDGACVDQSLTTGVLEYIETNPTTFSCLIAEVEGYSDLSVFLNEQVVAVKQVNPSDKNTRVSLNVGSVKASNGFVSLYSEGHLRVENCVLQSANGNSTDESATGAEPGAESGVDTDADADSAANTDTPVTDVDNTDTATDTEDNVVTDGNSDAEVTSARYRLTFNATWSVQTHPVNFPPPAHFSPLAGAVHNDQVVFWRSGETATDGVELMAETGDASGLLAEVASAISDGSAASAIDGGGVEVSPGSVSIEFEVTRDHPLVTVTSMVAPSPDWFVGVRDLSLFDGSSFIETLTLDLPVYDSGTDSGTGFTSSDQDTQPAATITRLSSDATETNFQNGLPSMGQFVIVRLP